MTASNPTGANALIIQASYGLNGNNNHNLNTLPCQTLASNGFMYDGITVNPDFSIAYRIMGRHGKQSGTDRALIGQTNIAFFDGHSETAPRSLLLHDAAEFTGASTAFTHRTFIWRLDQ